MLADNILVIHIFLDVCWSLFSYGAVLGAEVYSSSGVFWVHFFSVSPALEGSDEMMGQPTLQMISGG